jgi:very-short-patch-repair endonuclease
MTEIFNKKEMKERRQLLRRNMPKSETILWSKIRMKQIGGCRFRRQYSVGAYVLDFYCPDLRLAIEIDGESHDKPTAKEYDQEREEQIKQLGITIIRFTNSQIETKLEDVVQYIRDISASLRANQAIIFPLVKGKTQKGSKAINVKADTHAN